MPKRLVVKNGDKYGRLTVVKELETINKKRYFECICECGKKKRVVIYPLISGKLKSCGCFRNEKTAKLNYTHGLSDKRLYRIWSSMKGRCSDKNDKYYGGKGVKVCNEWINDFMNFYDWSMKNGYEKHLSIERINVDGDYEPRNCEWIDFEDQKRNTTRTKRINFNGENLTLRQWSLRLGGSDVLVSTRLRRGWSIEKALTIPPKNYKGVKKC